MQRLIMNLMLAIGQALYRPIAYDAIEFEDINLWPRAA